MASAVTGSNSNNQENGSTISPAPKPLITANMVTALRLLAMPLLAWLLYQGPLSGGSKTYWWWGISLGTIIGCTDFVDGMLARKYGPTVLGGMMDPLADKVFIALVYLPLMDLGLFPVWAVGLLFIREFLVTSIRSAYEWRGLQLKTSYFGKVKTWVQMQGIAILLFTVMVTKETLLIALAVLTVAPLLAFIYLYLAKKKFNMNAFLAVIFTALTYALFAIPEDLKTSIDIAVYAICLLTWLSGLDYLLSAIPTLHKAGGFHRADLVRVAGAIATPICSVLALIYTNVTPMPILIVFAGELAVGGLDNLLSRHKASSSAWSVGARSLGSAALLLGAILFDDIAAPLAWAAMVLSLGGVTWEFYRGRSHYLDDSKWDEGLVEATE